ncbi:lytic transglycosylase domain-containing protein [Aminobacter sp. MDW-2]|uniref:lytic transglycosylase domain-containing protein n=1 Tax=Aminobacter sp. MDW-2 TaxID=2666139 RepID=UPI0012AF4E32|nr:lytic transglycosylase domain-containing protein [Aminobacter sp. MDW-2]MRX33393.1 transglycosylase SLT domain-containing protein [Aminobacter sp. MDW-2]QNH33549.1 lytic transglycosylase domain-containing protein [Aminobacter sp. MDW-2]
MTRIIPAARPHHIALLSAFIALAPVPAGSSALDPQATSAIPFASIGKGDAARAAFGTIDQLKSGLDALSSGDLAQARAVRDALPATALDRHILMWAIAINGGDQVPSADIAAAAQALPGWPGLATLRRNSERAMARETPGPNIVVSAFAGSEPQTIEGALLLARAHKELGNAKAALAVLQPFWRTEKLDAKYEVAILKDFGNLIPAADHRIRMERMLYADRVNSAARVAELAGAKPLADAWAAVIKGDKKAQALLDAVPASQRSAGYVFAKARLLRKQEKFTEAAAVMLKAPRDRASLIDPDTWWVERRVLSRELLDEGDVKTAYRIAAAHSAENATNAADAEFHAGWYALRGLNDAKLASGHFERIAKIAGSPISLSRAYYWLGRSAEAGGPGNAKDYFARAATYGTSFYGQLAAERIGRKALNVVYPAPTSADRQAFAQREAVSAITRLEGAGYAAYAEMLYRDLASQLNSPGELALLAVMAEKQDNHYLALRVGKIAAQRGLDVGALSHPIGVIPGSANISGSGKALAYAIARQESEFKVSAVSSAGARGLLQLMPGTARDLAKKAGMAFSQERLTSDAGYNATLGASFLGEQLGRFNGSYVLTFAGYNAGPRRADQWISRYGDPRGKDVDTVVDWIERIPYAETRSYVQRVMENYQVYKMRLSGSYDINGDLVNGR